MRWRLEWGSKNIHLWHASDHNFRSSVDSDLGKWDRTRCSCSWNDYSCGSTSFLMANSSLQCLILFSMVTRHISCLNITGGGVIMFGVTCSAVVVCLQGHLRSPRSAPHCLRGLDYKATTHLTWIHCRQLTESSHSIISKKSNHPPHEG